MNAATHISDRLCRVARGWVVLAAVGVFVVFLAVVLPRQAAQADRDTGDAGSPDSSFIYTPANLYGFAEQYGASGRAAYIRARFTFDVVWPLVYAAFLSTSISWVYRRAFNTYRVWRRMNLAPVLGMLFDYGENMSTSLVMARYPARTPVVDVLAPTFTAVKWIFVNGSFVLLLFGIVVGLWRWKVSKQPIK